MRSKVIKKLAIVVTLVLLGFIVLLAFPAEADKDRVEFEVTLTVPANDYQYGIASIYVPGPPDSALYVASFYVPTGQTVKFYPFDQATLELWREGKFQPTWVIGSHGDFGMSISTGASNGENINFYLLVLNEATSSLDAKVQMIKTWHESNYVGLLSGSVALSLAIGVLPMLIFGKNKRQLGYSATIFAMTYIMIVFTVAEWYRSYPPYPPFIHNLTESMPGVLFFEAFPLIVLLHLLDKNKAFAYFKNWNMGRKLQISGVFLIVGYVVPIVFMLFGMLYGLINLSRAWLFNPYSLVALSLIVSGVLMFTGLMLFIALWATYSRRKSFTQLQT